MFKISPYFIAEPLISVNPWKLPPSTSTWSIDRPKEIDAEKKKIFGERLAKGDKPYDAAIFAFGDQATALWATQYLLRDPLVIETRENVENSVNLLDKDQLSVKLLKFADEKVDGRFIHESKDRLAALKLYAEIQGHIGKVNVDLSKNTFNNNEMKITFVDAESEEKKQELTIIENNVQEDLDLGIDLKLVG